MEEVAAGAIFDQVRATTALTGAPSIKGKRRPQIEAPRVRINDQIRLSPVRLVDHEGTQVGIVPLDEARRMASDVGLDLVEVAADSRPIVVRIMDYGKHRFEANKKAKEARKKESRIAIKQVKLRPNINIHDLETKLKHAERFLKDGDKVKVTIMFRGRDMRRPENGRKLLQRVIELMKDTAIVETAPGAIVNRDMNMVLAPSKAVAEAKKARDAEELKAREEKARGREQEQEQEPEDSDGAEVKADAAADSSSSEAASPS